MNSKSIDEAYLKLVEYVLINGEIVHDERGTDTLECMNLVMHIKNPIKKPYAREKIPKGCVWNKDRLKEYSKQLLTPINHGFIYTYGERLRSNHNVDQLNGVINRLKTCKNSRRATAVTWEADVDFIEEDVPCLILLDFKIRENKLHTTAVWRSHDIYGAYFPNLHGIASVMKYVADEVGVGYGGLITHSISAHIYEHDVKSAKRLINLNKKGLRWF